jgi:hypothetical protein
MKTTPALQEAIIEELSLGPRKVSLLVQAVAARNKTTIQGVYKALRILKKEEVATLHRGMASLSILWVEEKIRKMQQISKAYKASTYIQEIQKRSRGTIKFTFSTLFELDLFWTHFFIITEEAVSPLVSLYMTIPHDWFFYLRTASDTAWVNKLVKTKRPSKMIITHAAALDKKIMSERKKALGKLLEYGFNHNPIKQKEEEYYNIIGPWTFIARLDKTVSHKIANFFKNAPASFSKNRAHFLNSVIKEKGAFTLTIIYSEKKATALAKKVQSYFD